MSAQHSAARRSVWAIPPGLGAVGVPRSVAGFVQNYRADLTAAGVLLAVAAFFSVVVVRPATAFIRGDWPTQFFPVYAYLGERLRAFDIPGWNPYQFSGAPFAGDPESGWMYLPAMAVYALLPAETATVVYIGLHIALAGLAVYAFARLLGLGVLGSVIGGGSFAFAWVAPGSMHLVIFFPVSIWLIVALAGGELATRATTWAGRLWSWLLAAFAISQILAVWLGQSSYYTMLVVAGWIVYRTLLIPDQPSPLRNRLTAMLVNGLAIFGLGFGLSAAGVLPRLAMVEQSSLAGGIYDVASAWEEAQTGFTPPELLHEVLGGYTRSLWWYTGAIAVALAVIAPVVARRWRPMPFFVIIAACSLLLALADPTPLHALFYAVLPRFQGLHEHSPERALILLGPAIALLAAATVTYLPRWDRSRVALAVTALVPAALVLALTLAPEPSGLLLSREVMILIGATSALVLSFALTANARVRQAALLGLLLLVVWDPVGRIALRGFTTDPRLERSLQESLNQDAEAFLHENGGAMFLQQQTATEPGRYAGFEPALLPDPATIESVSPPLAYRSSNSLNTPGLYWLLVHNWATWFGVDDIQGYNPIQSQRYVAFIDALNGHRQEYHERDLFPAGLTSPLLDLLNVRYLLVPADAPARPDVAPLRAAFPEVYADAHVRILENPDAFPRAWLVHQAQQVAPGEALALLAAGTVDARQVALLETPPPPLARPAAAAETATYVRQEPDRLELAVEAQAPALLLLSEVWDPGWQATVDGATVPVLLADHALRAVPVPAGEHQVVLTYEPPLLRLGLVITAATFVLLVAAAVCLGRRRQAHEATAERSF